ncbi:diiron oxygenase [Mycolicibacter hiberniae]|uniref:Membrane protein n=2 Tax=Mycolicibacter hiberniae TaxID=29314 RepID=A0A7I7X4K1_9MYCO|nr:diiron oxygenase [Mycolicibacter hiberniae]MCV7085202.1 diiron oxygenase [Mycolicibacter hiberniae]BBZ23228.1 membrane protein [Mycolicibacter hiberniae]
MVGTGILAALTMLLGAVCTSRITRAARARNRRTRAAPDQDYAAMLAALSANSERHRFDPLTDLDWDAPEYAVCPQDPRWVLCDGPLARTAWYRRQPLTTQIAIGMWHQANIAKIALQFESMLIRGLVQYASRVPNGSPEHRYCLRETIEECHHVLMFQELVNRIGQDVPGMPRWMRRLSPVLPLYAGPFPNAFFFGVLAGEVPVDVIQTKALRTAGSAHPLVRAIMAVHVAEEARHICFADARLRQRVPHARWVNRVWMSIYVPVLMRVFARPIVLPPRAFFRHFGVPRSVRRQLRAGSAESRQELRDTFADIRMLCDDLGLMTTAGRLMWRVCGIGGPPSRYRGEPRRAQQATRITGN